MTTLTRRPFVIMVASFPFSMLTIATHWRWPLYIALALFLVASWQQGKRGWW